LCGAQEGLPADRAVAVLLIEQLDVVLIERGFDLAAPLFPVLGQDGVIERRHALNQGVPLDRGPGEPVHCAPAAISRSPRALVPESAVQTGA